MSHFSVLVIGPPEQVEEQLAPYMENCCETPDKKYMKFYDSETEYEVEWKENAVQERILTPDGHYKHTFDDVFVRRISARAHRDASEEEKQAYEETKKFWMLQAERLKELSKSNKFATISIELPDFTGEVFYVRDNLFDIHIGVLPDNCRFVEVPLQKCYKDFEHFVQEYHGAENRDPEMGRYGYWQNPNAKWDWYQIGGRWSGYLRLKPDYVGMGAMGQRSWASPEPKDNELYVDQAIKDAVDFEAMRQEKADFADHEYTVYEEHIDTSVPLAHWNDVREWVMGEGKFANKGTALLEEEEARPTFAVGDIDFSKAPPKHVHIQEDGVCKKVETPIEIARHLYHEQPRMQDKKRVSAIASDMRKNQQNTDYYEWALWGGLEEFDCTREEYVQRARDNAISTFAVLKDGQWMEKGSMGWWGMVSGEKDQKDWNRQFNEALDALPGHTTLTIVDCHI